MRAEGPGADDRLRRVHRALASINRLRLVRLLEDGPLDVAALTEATGLHANTVRSHLDVLVDAGLVKRRNQPGGRPGRPAWTYGLAAPPGSVGEPDHKLTMVLADALQRVADDPAVAAEAAGRPWGREAVAGEQITEPLQAIERVVEMLEEQGFAPELDTTGASGQVRVLLHRCPYDDLARRYGGVVCAVHLGVIRGALAELGASVSTDLRPMVREGLCVTELGFDAGPRRGQPR